MRDLKFRAWDKQQGRMVQVKALHSLLGVLVHTNIQDELMQYTGLKDKNDKEIYEGDIVRYNHAERSYPMELIYKGVIEYHLNEYHSQFRIRAFDCDDYTHDNIIFPNLEIIGNIYENPELLKGQ